MELSKRPLIERSPDFRRRNWHAVRSGETPVFQNNRHNRPDCARLGRRNRSWCGSHDHPPGRRDGDFPGDHASQSSGLVWPSQFSVGRRLGQEVNPKASGLLCAERPSKRLCDLRIAGQDIGRVDGRVQRHR